MLDDTCYLLGFDNYEEARVAQSILNSNPVQLFIQSLLFVDAKRVINKDLLMRIDFMRILEHAQNENLNVDKSDLEKFLSFLKRALILPSLNYSKYTVKK